MNAEQLNFPEPNVAVVAPTSSSPASEEGASNGAPGGAAGKSRRRRRKRKSRPGAANGEAGATPQATVGAEGGEAAAPAQNANQQQQPRQNNGQQQGQGQGQGKRWKKKKHGGRGDGQPRPEPGNSLQGSNSGIGNRGRNRKQQQRGPRSFVGPMDHSYREVNGNYADTPASTIEIHGNHRSRQNNHRNHHFNEDRLPPELMHHQRAVAIPEDAPTHIYFFIEDLFFTAKIQETARLQGVKVAFMKPEKDIVAHLAELPEHDHPSLIVFDLNNANAKPLTLIPKLKAKLKKGTSIIGFLSHLQGDLKAKAVEAGCNSVMPRAAFSQNLPNLLRRYGVEDEHEPNFNM
ncbi:hypothetical protein [Terriglobus sp. TAA 43]|uniref:hypothetical protein n=1 Tax=Terriglobus sp. TAA 43 TaxID=278961 RepID=UPI0006485299|nr:hypothetical protein [Terriglobus sp. TAA 43]